MRASGQRARASVRSRTNSASTISSYAEYSIAVTPCSPGPLRTVPRNRQVPPHSGDATSATRKSRERSEEHTSELQSQSNLVCRLLLEKQKQQYAVCDLRA